MKTCGTCACNWVCDHNNNSSETCGNWICKWISVEDGLPPENIEVLAAYDNGKVDRDFLMDKRWVFACHGTVTHWMLKPEAPGRPGDE